MGANQLSLFSQLFFLLLGVLTIIDYARHQDRIRRDIALMFGSIAIPAAIALFREVTDIRDWLASISIFPLIAQPYLLVRLAQYLKSVPPFINRLAFGGMILCLIALGIFISNLPSIMLLLIVGYFVVIDGYVMFAFIRGALVSSGVVRQRLRFAAFGSGLFAVGLGTLGLVYLMPAFEETTRFAGMLFIVTSSLCFYIGFAPPRWLRSVWQFTELRSFLLKINQQPPQSSSGVTNFLRELMLAANRAVAGSAAIILERNQDNQIRQIAGSGNGFALNLDYVDDKSVINQTWQSREPRCVEGTSTLSKTDQNMLDQIQAETLMVVPIVTGEHVSGLLLVFLQYTSLFPDDDLELLQLFAGQSAVFWENIKLIEQLQSYSAGLEQKVEERTRAVAQSEERFRSIFEQAAVGIAEASIEGQFMRTNERFREIVGYSADELRQLTFQEITNPDDLQTDLESKKALLAEEISSYSIEKRYYHRDGHQVWVNLTSSLIHEPSGESRFFLKVIQDISDRKRAEAARLDAEARFARVLDTTAEGVITIDTSHRIILFNQSAERIFGYSAEEMLGQLLDNLLPPEAIEHHREFVREFAEGPDISRGMTQRHGSLVARHKDGTIFPIEASISKLTEGDQVILTVFIQDITERTQAAEALQKLNEELEQRVVERTTQLEATNKELEAFSYSVSHDLRAPLRALDGFSQALLEDYEDHLDEEGKEYLTLIRTESQRMGQLIDDLINLARLTRTDLNRQEVNLSEVVQEIAEKLRQRDPHRQVEFVIERDLWVCADAHLMRVALQNLLDNAWKYSSKEQSACIEFGSVKENGEMIYFVRDNGVGFDMNYVHKLFGAFQRLHSVAEFEGTGIGLATIQRVIHQHGGFVRAEGVVNEGATFFFTVGQGICD